MPTDTETVAANDPTTAHRARDARTAHALTLFRVLFPAVFCDPPRPLAIGAHRELMAAAVGKFERAEIEAALKSWTGQCAYRQALAAGGPRYALDGTPNGHVTAEQQRTALAVKSRPASLTGPVEPPPPAPVASPEPPPEISPRTGRPILRLKPRSAPPATAPV